MATRVRFCLSYGPRQANLVLIAYASSEGSGEPAHPRSLARTFAARSYKQWVKRNLQTESQIPGPSEWLGMRSWNLSWRNARRHKFAWRGLYDRFKLNFIAFKVYIIVSIENATLSGASLWHYMYTPKWYVTCGHTIFMTWRYPLNNNDVVW